MKGSRERVVGAGKDAPLGHRAALVVAHPGHELRVHGWLELARPLVFVLTDGSGHAGSSRLGSTRALLERAGCRPGSIFGRLTDRALYAAILDHDVEAIAALAQELARALIDADIDQVVSDALEGYNPGHDLCHVIADAAVELAGRAGRRITRFDFALVGRPDECLRDSAAGIVSLTLDDAAFARKLAATHAYAELAGEVAATFSETGSEAFRAECLRPVPGNRAFQVPPYYERHGEQRVAAGRYQRVLRYREHFAPFSEAVRQRLRGRG